jgi:hypothetical protein
MDASGNIAAPAPAVVITSRLLILRTPLSIVPGTLLPLWQQQRPAIDA